MKLIKAGPIANSGKDEMVVGNGLDIVTPLMLK